MKKYRIEIDHDRCVGDGLCRETAPATFAADQDGKSVVVNEGGDEPAYIHTAAEQCRLDAITLTDAETGEKVWPPE
jgi:ferredoxin